MNSLDLYGIIYKITNLINGKIYIGQTTSGFERRYSSKGKGIERVYKRHKMFKEYGHPYNKHLLDAIDKYGLNNFEVDEEFDVAYSRDELNKKEMYWIEKYNSYKNGYNNNVGGEGNNGYKGLEKENNPASRKIVQLDLDGNFIKYWECMTYVQDELGILISDICSVCNNQKKSASGYMWMYFEDYNKNKDNIKPYYLQAYPKTKVVQLSLDGKYIETFDSVGIASDCTNSQSSDIYSCILGNKKTCNNYLWIKESDYDINKSYFKEYSRSSSKEILMFDLKGNLINEFKSLSEASKVTGFWRYNITKNINEEKNPIIDFKFKYKYYQQVKV